MLEILTEKTCISYTIHRLMYKDILIILSFLLLRLPLSRMLHIPSISNISYSIIADMGFLVVFFLILLWRKPSRSYSLLAHSLLGWNKPKPIDVLLGIIGALLLFSLSWIITEIAPRRHIYDAEMVLNSFKIYMLIIIASIVEELFYRGYCMKLIKRYTNASNLIIIITSSCFFAIGHIYQGTAGVVFSFFGGIILSYLLLHYKSLIIPLLAHILYNVLFYTIYMFDSGV